jgi:hypothetical protein
LCLNVPGLEHRKEYQLSWLALLIFSFSLFRWNLARYLKIGHGLFRSCSSFTVFLPFDVIQPMGVGSASLSM